MNMEIVFINNKAYDISIWKNKHPGFNVFQEHINNDITSLFYSYHDPEDIKIKHLLEKYEVKNYNVPKLDTITENFIKLKDELKSLGLFNVNKAYYYKKYLFLFILALFTFLFIGYFDLIAGICFGLLIQQSAFIGHDLGHDSVMTEDKGLLFNKKYKKYASLFFGNFIFGVDGLNWSKNHNTHHRLTLVPGKDPQNEHLPFLLYKKEELTYVEGRNINIIFKLILKLQHIYILPLLFIVGRVNLVLDLDNRELISQQAYFRILAVIFHIILWIILTSIAEYKMLFLIPSVIISSFIHLQILLSHAYMPRIKESNLHEKGWIYAQTITTLDIQTNWYDEWFHGGLQYQLAHHLFTQIPRHNLKRAQPIIAKFCKENNLDYNIEYFHIAVLKMLKSLKKEADSLKLF